MPVHLLWFLVLGCFWGLTPSFYKLMGEAGLPVSHIIVYTGLIVGAALVPGVFLGRWLALRLPIDLVTKVVAVVLVATGVVVAVRALQ